MKSFKFSTVSFLSTALLFSSSSVLAQKKLIETVPNSYYLEETTEDGIVPVRGCYKQATELHCPIAIEVTALELENFLTLLHTEAESLNNKTSYSKLAGVVFLGITAILMIRLKKRPQELATSRPLSRGIRAFGYASIGSFGLSMAANILKETPESLAEQLESGVLSSNERALIAFTDFLNEYGELVAPLESAI